jgi:hypothetical protein
MRLLLLCAWAALPLAAQFRHIEIKFTPTECANCTASMPERIQRIRGVETAAVDTDRRVLTIELAPGNRVRLEQVRDLIEQDGTRATSALVQLRGEIARAGADWTIAPAGVRATYRVAARDPLAPGMYVIHGDITDLHPKDTRLTIETTAIGKVAAEQ